MLILVLNYQKSNIYDKKNPCIHTFYTYKGLMQGFVLQSVLCKRSFNAVPFRHSFLFVTRAKERRVGIGERFISDIVLALRVNIAYAFFEARRESQPSLGAAIS